MKLQIKQVVSLKNMIVAGVPRKQIAEHFGVSESTVKAIKAERIWKDVKVPGFEYKKDVKKKNKLSYEDAQKIREKHSKGKSVKDIAKEYGVHRMSVSKIVNKKTYISR